MRKLGWVWLLVMAFSIFPFTPTQAIDVGEFATLSLGTGADGEPVLPENLRGKVVVALYWASWCPYCRKAMPDFLSWQNLAAKNGLQVVFVNVKEDREVFRNAKRWAGESTALMAHDRKSEAMQNYGGESFPYLVLIDRKGIIRKLGKGYGESSRNYYATTLTSLLKNEELAEDDGGVTFEWKYSEPASDSEAKSEQDAAPIAP